MSRRVAVFREDESGKIHRYFIYTRTRKVTEPFYQYLFVLRNKMQANDITSDESRLNPEIKNKGCL